MTIELICPADHAPLRTLGKGYECRTCGRFYRKENGVVRLLKMDDDFYEGAYGNQVQFLPKSEKWRHVWPLWFINSGYLWQVRKLVRPGATVLELGCAGGVRYFGRRYNMIGCDLSSRALASAEFYHLRVQGDAAACIPLPDGSVDAVVSSYFWEHISPEIKPAILAECSRVLRAGGVGVFLFDVDTENPLIRHFRGKDSARYWRLFIEQDGHVGYQSLATNIELISSAGLCVEKEAGLEKTWLQGASVYDKLATFPGGKIFRLMSATKSGRLFYFWTALVRVVDALVCPLLPPAWARISLVTFRKRQEMNGAVPRIQIRDGEAK